MNRRNFLSTTASLPIISQLWPDMAFAKPNYKEYEKRALDFCESLYPVDTGTNGYLSVTGEPYIVLSDNGRMEIPEDQWIKKEGNTFGWGYGGKTPDGALGSFKKAFLGYTADKKAFLGSHTLHWRVEPELTCKINIWGKSFDKVWGKNPHEWYIFYARLLVTKKSPVEYFKRAREGALV